MALISHQPIPKSVVFTASRLPVSTELFQDDVQLTLINLKDLEMIPKYAATTSETKQGSAEETAFEGE